MQRRPDLVVFSHLRWDFVWQRPQHLLTRLARDRRVFFIEEPVPADGSEPAWQKRDADAVFVRRPASPVRAPGFHDDQAPLLRRLVKELVWEEGIDSSVAWFYTPTALPLLDAVRPRAVVFDCMDDLSAFRGAPPELLRREAELLRVADIVFTGGPSLYRAKKARHANVHCFPSSVDAARFGKGKGEAPDHADQAGLPRPRLGLGRCRGAWTGRASCCGRRSGATACRSSPPNTAGGTRAGRPTRPSSGL